MIFLFHMWIGRREITPVFILLRAVPIVQRVHMIQEPFFRFVTRSGIEDNVLAVFMLAGPPLILVLVLIGRTAVTTTIAAAYVSLFILYVAYKGIITGSV